MGKRGGSGNEGSGVSHALGSIRKKVNFKPPQGEGAKKAASGLQKTTDPQQGGRKQGRGKTSTPC